MAAGVLREVEGVRLNKYFPEECIRSALAYKPRPGDVFIVSYPKCGTTWVQHIVYNIYMDAIIPEDPQDRFFRMPFLELQGGEAAIHGRKPGALKTHLSFSKNPYSADAKYIYVTRNPYDCCVSYYYHTKHIPAYEYQDGTFDEFFDSFVNGKTEYGDYFDHLLSWYAHRDDPNVLFLTYEDLKKDTKEWVLKIADVLGETYGTKLREDPSFLDKVLDMCSLDRMKEVVNTRMSTPRDKITSLTKIEDLHPSLLKGLQAASELLKKPMTGDFIRKGIVGDWRNHFSEEQIKAMKRRIAEKTKNSDVMDLWKDVDLP